MIKGIEERRVILSFNDVSLTTDLAGRSESVDVSLNLMGGELSLIRIERQRQGTVVGDACAGLALPRKGAVYFLGKRMVAAAAGHCQRPARADRTGLCPGKLDGSPVPV